MRNNARPSPLVPLPVADIRTILVPVDCGPRTPALLRSASALARRVGAELVILHVYEPITFAPPHCTADQLRIWQGRKQEGGNADLQRIRSEFQDDPEIFTATFLAVEGYPETEICAVAKRMMADVILATTHGYNGFSRIFLGSKADQLIRRAPCPILILPHPAEGDEDSLVEIPHAAALTPSILHEEVSI